MRHPNPAATNPLQGTKLYEWGALSRVSLAALIVSPERAAEIMRLYPEEETRGRPGIIVAQERKRVRKTKKREREDDAGEEVDVVAEQDEMEPIAA
jgi:hypothetical protein